MERVLKKELKVGNGEVSCTETGTGTQLGTGTGTDNLGAGSSTQTRTFRGRETTTVRSFRASQMAKAEWGGQGRGKWKWCSYKRTTLIVCSINILFAFYVLRCLYSSVYLYSSNNNSSQYNIKYTPDQRKRMEESIRIRKAVEPVELVKVVKNITTVLAEHKRRVQLPLHIKHMIRDEILELLKELHSNDNATEQREAVENWRRTKLQEEGWIRGQNSVTSTISPDEAAMLVEAMKSKWSLLMEEIGLWIPPTIIHKEHDDKPPGIDESEEDPLPGRPVPPECHAEPHTDYDGAAVRWGLTHHKESASDCCQACMDHARRAKPDEMKCNIWVYCPSETGCYSPDIYEHKHQECWLKYAEKPKLNFKDKYTESYRNDHPTAPLVVPWVSGVVSI